MLKIETETFPVLKSGQGRKNLLREWIPLSLIIQGGFRTNYSVPTSDQMCMDQDLFSMNEWRKSLMNLCYVSGFNQVSYCPHAPGQKGDSEEKNEHTLRPKEQIFPSGNGFTLLWTPTEACISLMAWIIFQLRWFHLCSHLSSSVLQALREYDCTWIP